MLRQQFHRFCVGIVQDARDFFVDHLGGVLAELALLVDFLAQERDALRWCDRRPGRAVRSCPSA